VLGIFVQVKASYILKFLKYLQIFSRLYFYQIKYIPKIICCLGRAQVHYRQTGTRSQLSSFNDIQHWWATCTCLLWWLLLWQTRVHTDVTSSGTESVAGNSIWTIPVTGLSGQPPSQVMDPQLITRSIRPKVCKEPISVKIYSPCDFYCLPPTAEEVCVFANAPAFVCLSVCKCCVSTRQMSGNGQTD